jgi:hypothetical protein
MMIILISLFFTSVAAFAKEDWICTEASSKRNENQILLNPCAANAAFRLIISMGNESQIS